MRTTSRRALLRGAALLGAGAVVAACARQTNAVPSCHTSGPKTVVETGNAWINRVPRLLATYRSQHPAVAVLPGSGAPAGRYVLKDAVGHEPPAAFVSLSPSLTALNFDPATLLPGAFAAFASARGTFGLPSFPHVTAVAWRTDVFGTLGLAPPAPDWTLADLESACEVVQAAASAGSVPGLRGAMPVLVGATPATDQRGRRVYIPGRLTKDVWAGFVLGYDGSIALDSHFSLTNSGALAGLDRLLEFVRRVGSLRTGVAPTGVTDNGADTTALQFVQYPFEAPGVLDPRWRFARFPRMPAVPVIPVEFQGLGVMDGQGATAGGSADPTALDAATGLLLWLYAPAQRAALSAVGVPPVDRDAGVQATFWAHAPGFARPVGQWQEFVDYMAGWPGVPAADPVTLEMESLLNGGGGSVTEWARRASDGLNAALSSVPASLPAVPVGPVAAYEVTIGSQTCP